MPSAALEDWRGRRANSIRRLFDAHTSVGGSGPGRRWLTAELNQAIVLKVAAEFQAFSRALYLEAAAAIAANITPPELASVVQQQFGTGLKLTRENAQAASLGADFGRLGSPSFWEEMEARNHGKTERWKTNLNELNSARNALAHQDEAKLAELHTRVALTLRTARRWNHHLDRLAEAMDEVVSARVTRLTGVAPW